MCDEIEYTVTDETLEIETLAQLQCLGHETAHGTLADDYILVDDIEAKETRDWNDGDGFKPIGSNGDGNRWIGPSGPDAFTGTLDGNGHTIRNLTIQRFPEDGEVSYEERTATGMISLNEGTISDVVLENVTVAGGWFVGGLVGFNELGEITDTHVTGTVTGTDRAGVLVGRNFGHITASSASGTVASDTVTGGLTGGNSGLIVDSEVVATVQGDWMAGGFVGGNNGQIVTSQTNSTVTGRFMVGGFVGGNNEVVPFENISHQVVRSSATGTVRGEEAIGGFVGVNDAEIRESYAVTTVDGNDAREVGGFAGGNWNTITQSYAAGAVMHTGGTEVGGFVGNNTGSVASSYWDIPATSLDDSDGGVGLGTLAEDSPAAAMTGSRAVDTMTEFRFSSIWVPGASGHYPQFAGAAEPVLGCAVIDEPGEYELMVDIFAAEGTCLSVETDDVAITGNDQQLVGFRDSTVAHPPVEGAGISVGTDSGLTNVTLENLTVTGWECGVSISQLNSGTIRNITAVNNSVGICIEDSDAVALTGTNGTQNEQNVSVGNSELVTDDQFSVERIDTNDLGVVGEPVRITYHVTNIGSERGTQAIVVTVNGDRIAEQQVELAANDSYEGTVTYRTDATEESITVTVTSDDDDATLEVPLQQNGDTDTEDGTIDDDDSSLPPAVVILGGLVAILGILLFYRQLS